MERDPVRYVWRHSRSAHLLALVVTLVLIPVTWLALDMPRLIIDDAILGRAFASGQTTAPFLPLVLDLPYPLLDEPVVLFRGVALERTGYFVVACATLVGLAAVRALVLGAVGLMRGAVARRLAGYLRLALFRRMAAARFSAREEATAAADLAGRGVASVGPFLGEALMAPVLALSEIVVAVLFAATLSIWLGLALLAIAVAHAVATPFAEGAERRRAGARRVREADLTHAAKDVARRSLAIRVHGTAAAEEVAFARILAGFDRVLSMLSRRLTIANMARGFVREIAAVAVLAAGGALVLAGAISLGGLVAALVAATLLPRPVAALVDWRSKRADARLVFGEIARVTGSLAARERRGPAGRLETMKRLVAGDLSALDPVSGVRMAGIDMALDLPSHVALVGDKASGAEVFARLAGGAIEPSSGSLSLDSADLPRLDGTARAGRIAFAGGEPVLLPGTLRDNLTYGAVEPADDAALVAAVTVAGLDDEVYALGLDGALDGSDRTMAAAVVDARRAVRAELAAQHSADLVDAFDPERYNRHATVAENLMFGVPVGDTFREANLARHPFIRAVLEAEGLTAPLAGMGLSIARSMIEMFEGVPDGHPLLQRFSFFSARDRGRYEELVARQAERRRGGAAARDRDLLLALALRYVETRHRLGLLDEALERWIIAARASFRSLLPPSLGPAVEFYDPDRLCAAASLADNLLFGRAAHDIAGAEERVQAVVRGVLAERGLDRMVFQVGLCARMGEREPAALSDQAAAVDLARCLVRKPDMLVVTGLFDDPLVADAQALLARVRAAMQGKTLLVVLPNRAAARGFDALIEFRQGSLVEPPETPRLATAVRQS